MAAPRYRKPNNAYTRMMQDLEERKRKQQESGRQEQAAPKNHLEIAAEHAIQLNNEHFERMRQIRERQERANRIIANYQMNRQNPAPWAPGGRADRLLRGAAQSGTQQEQKQEPKPAGFQDWSMAQNLLDPNSKVNALIKTRPQKEQDYWQGVRQDIGKAMNRGKGNDRAAKLLRPLTMEERMRQKQEQMESLGRVAQGQPINPLQNPRQYAQEVYDVRSGGTYTGNDPLFMNPEQLEAWKKKNQRGLEQTQRTDEQQAILRGRTMEAGEQHEVYRQLNQRGLPVEFNRGKMSLPEADQWESLPDEYFIKRRPEEYYRDDNAKYEYDKMMYDAIHGRGAYDAIALNDDATDEEIDALDAEVEHLWRQLEGGNFNVEEGEASADYFAKLNRENDTRTNGYQRNIDQADRYIGYLDRIAELEAGAPEGTYEYDPSKVNHNISLESGEADQLYYYANIDLSDEDLTDLQRYGNLRPEQFMTDAQRNTFNAYYENGQYAEATEYYKAMEPYLLQMKNEYKTLLEQRMYNNGGAIPMTLYRIATKPVEGVAGLGLTAAGLLGNEAALDTSSEWWDLSRTNQNIQNTSADAWARQAAEWFGGGDEGFAAQAGRFLNGVFFSMADNLTAFALSGGASKVSADAAQKLTQHAIQFIMSSEATAGTMFEQLEAGVDPTRAGIMAFGSGIIEAITEKYSLEQILDPDVRAVLGTKGAFMKYLGKASFAEGSEEIASDLLDTGLDFIMSAAYGDAPELIRNYEALIAEGMSEEEATRKVLGDYLTQLGSDGLAGALSGLLMSGSRGVQARGLDSYQTRSIGSTVVNRNVEEGMTAKEKSGEQYSNFLKLNEAAKMLQPGSEARRIAQEIEADVKKGGKVSMKKAGKLTRAIMQESNEQIGQVADAVLGDTLTQQLRDEGIAPEDAERYSAVLKNAVETGRMTPEAMLILSQDERARGLWSEIVKSEDVQSARAAQKSVMDLITTPGERAAENIRENVAAKMAVARYVTEADAELQEALDAGEKRTGSPLEVVADGKIGNVTGFGLKETKDENGKKYWYVTVKVKTDAGTIEVDANDVRSTNEGAAQVLALMQAENGQSIGEHMGLELMKIAQTNKDIAGAATDAINMAVGDLLGQEVKTTALSGKEKLALKEALEADKRAGDAAAAENKTILKPGQGKITLDGIAFGTKEFAENLNKYGETIRNEANYVATLMQRMGMDVDFYYDDSEEGSARQGAFVGTKGIRLNLAGTFTRDGVHRSIVATAAHEATHWLRANAAAQFRQLAGHVMKTLQNNGVDVHAELRHIMDNYGMHGEQLTLDKAAEEMAAMGCEELFTNEKLVSELQAEDPSLYGRLKQVVKRVLNMMQKVVGENLSTSSRRYAVKVRSALDEIGKAWKITYEAAAGAAEAGMQANEETGRQNEEDVTIRETETEQQTVTEPEEDTNKISEGARNNVPDFAEMTDEEIKNFFKNNYKRFGPDVVIRSVIKDEKVSKRWKRTAFKIKTIDQSTGERDTKLYSRDDLEWMLNKQYNQTNEGNENQDVRHSMRDEDYADAVARGDWTAAENMLIEKMQQTEGITGYRAPHFYAGEHKDIARLIKSGDPDVINSIVDDMAQHVPENAVLVPMPPHEGKVTDSTDTKILAEALSKKTGATVIVALESDYHPSRYQAKASGDRSVNAQTMGFRQVEEIPEGMMPVFIDNMVGGGQTAIAAKNAIGRGITLAYAQSSRSKTKGVKIASVTYDSEGNLIPLSQRMDPENPSWKYSLQEGEIRDEDGDVLAEVLPGNTITKYSYQTWMDEDIESLTKQLITQGFKKKDVEKWIRDVNGVAAMIAANRDVLDYDASPYFRMLKNNQEYVKTLDASTLCAKRLLYQGIFNEIQSMLPNTPLMPQDLIKLINMMKEKGHVTPCGFCYVESRRKMLGKYAKQWLDSYQGENKPQLKDVTTTDGLEALRKNNPEAYDSFIEAMKAKGSANPKVVETRTAYRGEIREMTDGQIRKVKEIGGLRVQSFSDFEVIHMIDMMQAVLDMAAMDLTSQAYTKVPEFAAVFGDTGMKINLSLVGKGTGLNEKGELVFDDVEGMPWRKAMDLRKQYSKNVGTILVGINEAHIIAAMGDDRIDFIIPFHKSGWNKRELTQINGLSSYKDFTRWQNEKRIGSWNEKSVKTIPNKTSKISNFGPVNPGQTWDGQNGYWDFSKSGEENARVYLQLCKEDGRVPKFANFLEYDGEGGYRLPDGDDQRSRNIRRGYWKLLIDFKMYDNNGKGSPQTTVKPVFNMDAAREILENYDENARTLPTDHELAREYVKEYKAEHPGQKMFSIRDDTDYDVRQWMETVPEWSLQTEAEKQLLSKYKSMQMKQRLDRERMRKIDSDLLKLEAQLTEERTGRVEAEETMENALESAGVSVRDGHWLQKDGKIIGKINADGTIGLNKGVEENVYQTLRAEGFGFTNKKGIFRPVKSAPQNADGKPTIQALLGKSEAQRQRDALQKRKQDLQKTMDEQEEKLAEITKDEGFGRMMYQQQKVLDDLQNFGTQRELMDYVARMEKKAREVAARIEENRKATEALEKGDVVKRFRELLGTTTAEKTAAELKKEFSSSWTAKQIQAYLNPIILKMKSGQNFQQDVETLAGILVSSDSRNRYEALEDLRGLVITIGKGAQQELKAQNSSLKEVRARLAGTGIQVKYGDRSTLEADIEDLRAEYPMIPELGDEKDALGNFLNWVDSMKSVSAGMEFYDQRIAEAMAVITGKAAGAAKGIYMPNDPKAQQQVLAIMDFVKGLNAETAEVQKALADIAAQMGEMQKAGMAATNRATTLMRDVNVAIDYYQKIGKIAADEAKQKKQSAVIEQLKSKHAEEIVKNNEEWRALVQRDKDARAQLDENRKMTRQINTNLKRTFNLLKNPKGLQNIPEYMQGLAREVISKFVDNDLGRGARFIQATQKELAEWRRILDAWEAQNGKFDRNQLGAMDAENVKADVVLDDLDKITEGMKQLNAWKIYGKNKLDALQQRGAIIEQIRDAVSEIYTAIRAEGEVQAGDRRVAVEDAAYEVAKGTGGKKYREWYGSMGQKMSWLHKAIVSGNMTPEYFFRTLGNQGLSDLWENYHWAENKNGLELKKAKDRLAQIAEEYGYKNWDMKQKIKLNLQSGEVEITLGQMMSLWATWQREQTLGPEMSQHLTHGGFFADVDLRDGLLGRKEIEKRAHRVTEEDMNYVLTQLTVDQMNFIDAVVKFMSNDMSELGNAASMQAYGIKLYKESYYFPFQMWDGVKSRKSNDAGGAAAANDRAFHPSFSKSRQHGANNAVMIGDFMQVATDHIAGMINYATMGLANENLQKVLNAQTAEGYDTKRNTRALIEEAYGREAAKYLADLQMQLNGGAVHIDKTFYDKLISLFRKNAVAGSLSVALQQPLSYIRAAMMINPKYLARAISPDLWKGSYKEMLAHSGVAVIKDMGRFDMNFGQSAKEFLLPDGKVGKARKVWEGIEEYSTKLPELMDRMTWTRMWSAVKAEQKAQHPEMDVKSDEFLDMCGKRFNDLMRRTQVYDSTLVKSANMRNQNPVIKTLTSFMAEPTLTLNVLADSVRMAKNHEKGGMLMVGKASGLFLLSAVLQAAVKGLMGTGRTPDDKKTWWENFLYRFEYNFLNEADILQLVPGFSDAVTILKGGELKDDAWGALSKMIKAGSGTVDLLLRGSSDKGTYRDIEDSAAQLAQMFTGVPLKNLMRDGRAMWNWTIDRPYADREDSAAVIGGQAKDLFYNADNLIGVLNTWLGEAGHSTNNNAYYARIYEAKKAGDDARAQSLIDYLLKGKGIKQESIDSKIAGMAKKDENASAADTAEFLIAEGANAEEYIRDRMRKKELTADEARDLLQKADPEKDADSIWWTVDRIQYQLDTGAEKVSGNYYRLWDAMDNNKAAEIRTAVKTMTDHGMEPKNIKTQITKQYKDAYLKGTNSEKVKIKGAIEKAYKELGYSTEDADKVINNWK